MWSVIILFGKGIWCTGAVLAKVGSLPHSADAPNAYAFAGGT
jgi:hypothetical protein